MSTNLYERGRRQAQIGEYVGFKCDIEQYGRVVKIEKSPFGYGRILTLENNAGFEGAYIVGRTRTTIDERDVWFD